MQKFNTISNSTKELFPSEVELRKDIRKEYSQKVKKFKNDIYSEINQLKIQKNKLYEEKCDLQKKVYELEDKIKECEIERFIESNSKWSGTPMISSTSRKELSESDIKFNVKRNFKEMDLNECSNTDKIRRPHIDSDKISIEENYDKESCDPVTEEESDSKTGEEDRRLIQRIRELERVAVKKR